MNNITLSACIMSGKGGVGKTNIALNLSYALNKMFFSNLIIDCDLGLANIDILLGITPKGNIQDILMGNGQMKDVLCPIEPKGFDILPAASGLPDLVELNKDARDLLIDRLNPELSSYDYVMLDLGAGIHDMVQDFAAITAMRIVVVTPELTSLSDSYALMKVLNINYGFKDFMVIVNQVESKKEEKQTFSTLQSACKRFLNVDLTLLGCIRQDPKIVESVQRQEPLMRWASGSPAGVDFQNIAINLQQIRLRMLDELAKYPVLRPVDRLDCIE